MPYKMEIEAAMTYMCFLPASGSRGFLQSWIIAAAKAPKINAWTHLSAPGNDGTWLCPKGLGESVSQAIAQKTDIVNVHRGICLESFILQKYKKIVNIGPVCRPGPAPLSGIGPGIVKQALVSVYCNRSVHCRRAFLIHTDFQGVRRCLAWS